MNAAPEQITWYCESRMEGALLEPQGSQGGAADKVAFELRPEW